jgi:DNA repair exonuclease SbcCD ATPase subunit
MITLKTLTWSNCFSYGKDNILKLDSDILVQLIGENGAGKSSIPIILEEALFNKNSKGVKKADIVNRSDPKNGYTIGLSLEVGGKEYTISINRKSSLQVILECNGEDISSHTATNTFKTIENIIGTDFKTFSQLVYQSTTNSLQFLTATDTNRKKFLIELLNLDNYLQLFDNFKGAHKDALNEVSGIKGSIDTINKWLNANKILDNKKRVEKKIPLVNSTALEEQGSLKLTLKNITKINSSINTNNQYISMLSNIPSDALVREVLQPESDSSIHEEVGSIKGLIRTSNILIKKLEDIGEVCPTCLQNIDEKANNSLVVQHKDSINSNSKKIKSLEIELKGIEDQQRLFETHNKTVQEFTRLNSLIDKELPSVTEDAKEILDKLKGLESIIAANEVSISEVIQYNTQVTKFNTELAFKIEQIKDFKKELELNEKVLKDSNDTYANLEVLKKAFSTNGLVAYKIENLVKDLEDLVNEYLAELSDGRFGLIFEVSNDKLNVIISDNGKDIGILALSSGELARVNTATLLAIRRLMSTLSKSRINILFLDEVINVLDNEGRERLIEILLKENELNTFLVSHGYSHPLLTKVNIVKEKEISRLE